MEDDKPPEDPPKPKPKRQQGVPGRKSGHPSTTFLTPEIQEKFCAALRDGATYERASRLAGIGHSTSTMWRAFGQTPGKPQVYVDFYEAAFDAREEWIEKRIKNIVKAAETPNEKTGQLDWRADAFLLETMERSRFGRKRVVEHEGEIRTGPAAPMLDVRGLSDEQLDQLEALLEIAAKTSEARREKPAEPTEEELPPIEEQH